MAVATVFGLFSRRAGPSQTDQDALEQVASREVWGRPARFSDIPCVKAYRGALQPKTRGIEFTTPIAPDHRSSSPFEVRWYYPDTPGVELRRRGLGDYAAIQAKVINFQLGRDQGGVHGNDTERDVRR